MREDLTRVDETDTWEVVLDELDGLAATIHVMECEQCGMTYEHVNGDYEHCPHCGRKIVTDYSAEESKHVRIYRSYGAYGTCSCGECGRSVEPFDVYCRWCGVKFDGTEYESAIDY